tara:strand:+ start:206 stop:1885 length:1680 start_codon:yes stop_codon:yes gene_type:complete
VNGFNFNEVIVLRGVSIKDILIIDELELLFEPGLNVLTGETGAGKSILLDCLGFVLGWRGQAEIVRLGAEQGEVTAWFDIDKDHAVNGILNDSGIEVDDELILRRVNGRDGRKTAFVNGRRCSGRALRLIGGSLIELHGQHDNQGLLNVSGHLELLDNYARVDDLKNNCKITWNQMSLANKTLVSTKAQIKSLKEEEDYLRHTVDELSNLNVKKGDEDRLDERRRLMHAASKIQTDVANALKSISREGAEDQIADAIRWIENASKQLDGQLVCASDKLKAAYNDINVAQQEIESVLSSLNFNAEELEQTEEQLFAIRALARKHAVMSDELPNTFVELSQKLESLDRGKADLERLEMDLAEKNRKYDTEMMILRNARISAALVLDEEMLTELVPLKMEHSVFKTEISNCESGPMGADKVAFTVETNPGSLAGPLEKIASGGELSRFLLALKVCLSKGTSNRTMIFDEIDRGVGGATADAVGRRLKSLGKLGQVLVVTHSPQVAAFGSAHWKVEKDIKDEKTLSRVTKLSTDDRVNEIARMLAGEIITKEARGAARSLLKI